ncbi:hypothetical protein ACFL6U_26180 [Planctomycetota bacterium]
MLDSGQFACVGRQYSAWSDRFFAGLIDDVRFSSCTGFNCGGIYCQDGAAALIMNCAIIGNTGSVNGGIRIVRNDTGVVNCVIANNASAGGGGGGGGVRCDYGPGTPLSIAPLPAIIPLRTEAVSGPDTVRLQRSRTPSFGVISPPKTAMGLLTFSVIH